MDQLATFLDASYVESPLREVVSELSASLKLPITIDTRSLEEIGLDSDTPVSCELDSVSAYDLISILLRDLDLTLSVRNNLHVVMSVETADECLLSRIYWLEGLGLAGQYDSIIQSIESTVVPDTWEALGGSSTLVPAPGGRPGMVVSTTYDVHRSIERLIKTLRENSFSLDAVVEDVEVPLSNQSQGGGFGGQANGQGGGFM